MNPALKNHHWLLAGLVTLGWNRDVASVIAFRFLTGQTLFPNESADAAAVNARL